MDRGVLHEPWALGYHLFGVERDALTDHLFEGAHPSIREYANQKVIELDDETAKRTFGEKIGWKWRVFLIDDVQIMATRGYRDVKILLRKPSNLYWPTESETSGLVDAWAEDLIVALARQVRQISDGSVDDWTTIADHWRCAKRRYGCKGNSVVQLANKCGVDPERRAWYSRESYPPHVIAGLHQSDAEVGALLIGLNELDDYDLGGN